MNGIRVINILWNFLRVRVTFKKPEEDGRMEKSGSDTSTGLIRAGGSIDETWAKTNMTRTHGRSRRGERLVARVPHGHWTTMTFIAALRHDRIDAPMVLDGPINGTGSGPGLVGLLTTRPSIPVSGRARQPRSHKGRRSGRPSAGPGPTCSCRPTARTSIHRTGLLQAEDPVAQGRRAHRRGQWRRSAAFDPLQPEEWPTTLSTAAMRLTKTKTQSMTSFDGIGIPKSVAI